MPNNQVYSFLEDQSILIGKSTPKSKIFDILYFAGRKIKTVTIPRYIKQIGPFSFQNCQQLQTIEIEQNSELQVIGKLAFSGCSVESLTIPSSILEFGERWCSGTYKLTKIKINQNEHQNIFYLNDQLIVGKNDTKSDIFDIIYFARRDITKVTIPSYIKRIGSNAFSDCEGLKKIEFHTNSELQKIEKYTFGKTSIRSISIPTKVTEIEECAFISCDDLQIIEFACNFQLKPIKINAFDKFNAIIMADKKVPLKIELDRA